MVDLSRLGPYGEAPGSVLASLNKMSRRERVRYWINVKRHRADQDSLERWASDGFTSQEQQSYGVEEREEED